MVSDARGILSCELNYNKLVMLMGLFELEVFFQRRITCVSRVQG